MHNKQQGGFTLIEVLIAGVILFTVLVTVSQTYRASNLASVSATEAVRLQGTVPLLMDTIHFYLTESSPDELVEQEGVINDLVFRWQAEVTERAPPPDTMSATTGEFEERSDKFYLWAVRLTLEADERQQSFEYKELTWNSR